MTVDNIIINGTEIGHTSDTDLITLASGVVSIAGEMSSTTVVSTGVIKTDSSVTLKEMTNAPSDTAAYGLELRCVSSTARVYRRAVVGLVLGAT